jgi:hypothetical protein
LKERLKESISKSILSANEVLRAKELLAEESQKLVLLDDSMDKLKQELLVATKTISKQKHMITQKETDIANQRKEITGS